MSRTDDTGATSDDTSTSRRALTAIRLMIMAIDTSKPFTRKAGLSSGLTVHELTGSGFRRLLHGVYIGSRVRQTVAVRARAALLVSARGSFARAEAVFPNHPGFAFHV